MFWGGSLPVTLIIYADFDWDAEQVFHALKSHYQSLAEQVPEQHKSFGGRLIEISAFVAEVHSGSIRGRIETAHDCTSFMYRRVVTDFAGLRVCWTGKELILNGDGECILDALKEIGYSRDDFEKTMNEIFEIKLKKQDRK